jgi:AraC-like DNA-binding protein
MAIDDHLRRRPDQEARFGHLLALLHGDLAARDRQDEDGGLGRRRRLELAAWASAHLHQRPAPGDLAAVVGLSTGWFRRAFRRSFGCSPRTWLTRERVRRAAQRLAEEPGLKVADLARELGYEDHRLLDRQFQAVMGVSPGRWRRG